MSSDFDCVIVGAGMAGLCCAGELILNGQRPRLVSETAEVGAIFATKTLGKNNTAFIQHLTWQQGWGGGWWYRLLWDLNVPLQLHPGVEFQISIAGTDQLIETPVCVSAAALADVLVQALPDMDRVNLEKILGLALAIPYEQLYEMHRVPLGAWLDEQGASEPTANIILRSIAARLGSR